MTCPAAASAAAAAVTQCSAAAALPLPPLLRRRPPAAPTPDRLQEPAAAPAPGPPPAHLSRLGRTSSAPAEAAEPHDRRQLTGAWVAAGGRMRVSEALERPPGAA